MQSGHPRTTWDGGRFTVIVHEAPEEDEACMYWTESIGFPRAHAIGDTVEEAVERTTRNIETLLGLQRTSPEVPCVQVVVEEAL